MDSIYKGLVVGVTIVGFLAEVIAYPKKKDNFDIPKGDWLTPWLIAFPHLGVIGVLLRVFLRSPQTPDWFWIFLGLIFCFGCIFVRAWGKFTLKDLYTLPIEVRENHKVINHGPYRFVRHPMYFGVFLGIIGYPLLTQSWLAVCILSVPTGVVFYLRMVFEDRYLLKSLAPAYVEYAQQTPRLIPFCRWL